MNKCLVVFILISIAVFCSSSAADEAKDATGHQPAVQSFIPLAPGAIEPLGWLRDWAISMRDGMTGHLDEYDPVFQSGWLGKRIGTTGEGSPGEGWPLEQTAYWIDGAIRLGHVLHDDALLARVVPRLDKIAGPENHNSSYLWWRDKFSWDGKNGPAVEGFDLWSCGVLGRALIAQYQATGDKKWLACIERFFGAMPGGHLFPLSRSTVNIETICEAARLGGDSRIWTGVVDAAIGLRQSNADWSHEHFWTAMKRKDAEHGVTFNELAKLPLLLYAGTSDESFKRAALERYQYLFGHHMLPHGVNSASEHLSGIGALQSTESCNVSDLIWSHIWLLRILGNPVDGDRIETAFFNAAPACVSRDCRTHVYYQSPNRQNRRPDPKGGNALTNSEYARTQKPLCCTANIQRILPNYIIHMWMQTPDRGLAATLYGPCKVKAKVADGADIQLTTTTIYPFGEDVTVALATAKPVRFPMSFRVPAWCRDAVIKVNGAEVKNDGDRANYMRIDRTWSDGDEIAVHFPMPPRVVTGRETGGAPYACVYAGPLLFARGITEKDENESMNTGWRYALDFACDRASEGMSVRRNAMPPRWDWPYASPVTLSVPAQAIDWELTNKGDAALPRLPVTGKACEMIDLIPYGCAKFRVSMFPVTPKAWGKEK